MTATTANYDLLRREQRSSLLPPGAERGTGAGFGKAVDIVTTPDIGRYGLLGDTRTAALVDETGSIDWMCLPHFEGDPVFARLVAGDQGGHFRMGPADDAELVARRYWPASTVIETTWKAAEGRLVLTEGMVSEVEGGALPGLCLVRRLEAQGGPVRVSVDFDPRFGDARLRPRTRHAPGVLVCTSGSAALSLRSDGAYEVAPGRPITVEVAPGRPLTVALTAADRSPLTHVAPATAWDGLLCDDAAWRGWCSQIRYDGPFAAEVERSLITLRLLTYSPSGAPVAAPTTSLPEDPGGSRNWDYRYAWPRDASIGIGAFLGVGLEEQARAFLYWLVHASRLHRPSLPALFTIFGRSVPPERELAGWPGFADSTPVRVGNGAREQHQLDGYGWVLDAMWLLVRAGHGLYRETWRAGSAMADYVAAHWHEPDAGIWEVRGDPLHYVHSKLMGWMALDRALKIADTHRVSARRRARWVAERAALVADIDAKGFDREGNTYTRAYGRRDADAALLIVPLLGLHAPDSPRVTGTVDAVRRELSAGGPLLYRYEHGVDGLPGEEGAFLPCSFWLVQALADIGRVDDAIRLFEDLVPLSGRLGLYAEEADPASGALLGNYPQALTHAALVQAALAIQDAKTG